MKKFIALTIRDCKVFFKDKGMFFTSLITPLILLVLYSTFLAKIYRDSYASALPDGVTIDQALINGTVGGQLISSLLAVSCITIAFCCNLLMVQDKTNKAIKDLVVSPITKRTLSLSYFASTFIATLIVAIITLGAGFIYLGIIGWYLSFTDVLLIILDIILLVLFGTAISSIISCFLKTNGQASAVGTIVSAGYGFICGAYMPISNFSTSLRNVLSFLPGTYGTALLRNHCMNGAFREMASQQYPSEIIEGIKDSIDCNLYFFNHQVSTGAMYLILFGSTILLTAIYVLINILRKNSVQ